MAHPTCKHCGTECVPKDTLFGHVVNCVMCGQRFIEAPRSNTRPGGQIFCSHCGQINPVEMAVAGSILACHACGGQFAGPVALPPAPETRRPGH